MCGICGIAGSTDAHAIDRMTSSLAHRGPDDHGVARFLHYGLDLGHRRLSIIDVSPRGRQPMFDDTGRLSITFNGEIYNYRELKNELAPELHHFKTETDTEVILHVYREHGIAGFSRLNGMFAFALLDRELERLFLVRDQLGVKPLYYTDENGRLIFGSEIKAILASNQYQPEIDWQSASDFFSFLYVPAPQTIFRGIRQLPPAHFLEYDLKKRCIVRMEEYWRVDSEVSRNEALLTGELRELMADAVKKQMVSDVPLGAFLSGGIDSNIIVGLMAQNSGRPVETFTVVFDEPGMDYYDERHEARRISERFGTSHRELRIDLSQPEEMLDLVDYFDQPFGNATLYLTYLLSRETRRSVTVALSGAGGDELFGGYPRYRAVQAARWLQLIPKPLAKAGLSVLSHWPDDFLDRKLHRVRALLDGLDRDPARQYLRWVYYFDEDKKSQLFKREMGSLSSHRVLAEHLARLPESWDEGNRFSFLDVKTFLPDNLLEYSDRMSMASSLELRVPYLDPRVVELAFRIPFGMKLRGGESKSILRRAFADLIPEENLRIPKKGFNVPLGVWMRTKLDRFFEERMPRSYVEGEGIFSYDFLQQLREQHRRGERDNAYELFAVLMFDTWYRKYITQTLERRDACISGMSVTPV
jgi:asparagine synthase (glutamine-hydrolysing)